LTFNFFTKLPNVSVTVNLPLELPLYAFLLLCSFYSKDTEFFLHIRFSFTSWMCLLNHWN